MNTTIREEEFNTLLEDLKRGKEKLKEYSKKGNNRGIRKNPELFIYLLCKLYLNKKRPIDSQELGQELRMEGISHHNEEDWFSQRATSIMQDDSNFIESRDEAVHVRWFKIYNRTKSSSGRYIYTFSEEFLPVLEKLFEKLDDDSSNSSDVNDLKENPDPDNKKKISKNTILYGPPGTGKTYNTRERTVEIINQGDDENE